MKIGSKIITLVNEIASLEAKLSKNEKDLANIDAIKSTDGLIENSFTYQIWASSFAGDSNLISTIDQTKRKISENKQELKVALESEKNKWKSPFKKSDIDIALVKMNNNKSINTLPAVFTKNINTNIIRRGEHVKPKNTNFFGRK